MNPHLRASDADRDRVADALQRHTAEGRLTLAEFDQRSAAAYAARTIGDLDAITADLPPLAEPAEPAHTRATGAIGPRLWVLAALLAALAGAGLIGGYADAAAAGTMMDGMCH
ncbi:MAG: DUF1707 domain-containing protein [Actinophytocola sp.]|nr:DUF1707 domain-containing protein [Actinophytocola sp.]